ncbi:aspartate/glutamate racemase family protein [Pseudomonas sp. PhalM4]
MTTRIKFINPWGTDAYDALIVDTLTPYANPGTELTVTSLKGTPEAMEDLYLKHLNETAVFEAVMQAEEEGYDAAIIGCCYDPGVRVARQLVDIPVIGPTEASMHLAPHYGHNYVLVTDDHRAVPYMRDMVSVYGQDKACREVSCVGWYVPEMSSDPIEFTHNAIQAMELAMEAQKAEAAILGCTIVAANYEKLIQNGLKRNPAILNPNTLALKTAESLAFLRKQGSFQVNRAGFYSSVAKSNPSEFGRIRTGCCAR